MHPHIVGAVGGVGQVFVAKQKYDAIGTRSNHVLSFEKGEELEVLAPTPGAEWVEVRVCNEFLEYRAPDDCCRPSHLLLVIEEKFHLAF